MALGDAGRITNVIRKVIRQETKSGARIEFVRGIVAVNNGNYVDIFLNGNEVAASQNFRVPAWLRVNVGDPVLAAIDTGSNLGKWVVDAIPLDTYAKLSMNPNTGEFYTSDGTSVPVVTDFSSGGVTSGMAEDLIWDGIAFVYEDNGVEDELLWS